MVWQKIKSIEEYDYDGDVYNLHVKDNHNYIANDIVIANCHLAAAASLTGIMERATQVPYKLGFTGTLSKAKTNELVIKGLFGTVNKVITTKQLMDDGHVTPLHIKSIILNYSDETNALFKKKIDYQKELNFIVTHDRRNKFIRNLALNQTSNTLVLFTLVEIQGEVLYNLIKDKANDRPVHFVHGGVDAEDRDEVRRLTEASSNTIIVASSGVFSTGVNIRNIGAIIFASPTKSAIRVLQSIGRGLRLHADKDKLKLFDIADKLNKSKSNFNHTYRHYIERLKIYHEQQFEYSITKVDIE